MYVVVVWLCGVMLVVCVVRGCWCAVVGCVVCVWLLVFDRALCELSVW